MAATETPTVNRRRWLWISGLATLVLLAVLAVLDDRIQRTGGPGIVGFELAGERARANEILADWGRSGREAARLSLWLDFPYLVAYGAFWSLAVAATRDWAASRRSARLARLGGFLVAFPLAAAALDAVENVGLLVVLGGGGGSFAPALATVCALAKFALATLAILYVLAGLVARLAARRR